MGKEGPSARKGGVGVICFASLHQGVGGGGGMPGDTLGDDSAGGDGYSVPPEQRLRVCNCRAAHWAD